MNETHNDGMSSDDEVPDVELAQYRDQLGEQSCAIFTIVFNLILHLFSSN